MAITKGPSHYQRGNIQVWDFIRDQNLSYHLGCAVKYVCRAGYKDSKKDDLIKAIHYLQNELEHTITEVNDTTGSSKAIPKSLLSFDEWESDRYSEVFDR